MLPWDRYSSARSHGHRGSAAWIGAEGFPQCWESTRKHILEPANPCKGGVELHRDLYSCMYICVILIYLGIFHINSNNTNNSCANMERLCLKVHPYPSKLSVLHVNCLSRQTFMRDKQHFIELHFFMVSSTITVQNSPGRRNPYCWGCPVRVLPAPRAESSSAKCCCLVSCI